MFFREVISTCEISRAKYIPRISMMIATIIFGMYNIISLNNVEAAVSFKLLSVARITTSIIIQYTNVPIRAMEETLTPPSLRNFSIPDFSVKTLNRTSFSPLIRSYFNTHAKIHPIRSISKAPIIWGRATAISLKNCCVLSQKRFNCFSIINRC